MDELAARLTFQGDDVPLPDAPNSLTNLKCHGLDLQGLNRRRMGKQSAGTKAVKPGNTTRSPPIVKTVTGCRIRHDHLRHRLAAFTLITVGSGENSSGRFRVKFKINDWSIEDFRQVFQPFPVLLREEALSVGLKWPMSVKASLDEVQGGTRKRGIEMRRAILGRDLILPAWLDFVSCPTRKGHHFLEAMVSSGPVRTGAPHVGMDDWGVCLEIVAVCRLDPAITIAFKAVQISMLVTTGVYSPYSTETKMKFPSAVFNFSNDIVEPVTQYMQSVGCRQ